MSIERPGQLRLGRWPERVGITITAPNMPVDAGALHSASERCEFATSWIAAMLAPMATRLRLPAQSQLFQPGDCATSYYFVESGELLAHRRLKGGKSAIRRIREDELFILDCDSRHMVTCDAIVDSTVLRVDRRLLEGRARHDAVLKGLLQSVHAGELEFILRSLGANDDWPDRSPALRGVVWWREAKSATTTINAGAQRQLRTG